jgi:ferredoxin-thioredoxin reductase catalytic chain
MAERPSDESLTRLNKFVERYCKKSGAATHPDPKVTESVVLGLACNKDDLGRPLCPCRFYQDKREEVKHRMWICACDDMQIYKYCHCLLFVNGKGQPVTEYLPEDHEGRQIYGRVEDTTPERGRPLRDKAAEREKVRKERPS